jgi:hypothetical protein
MTKERIAEQCYNATQTMTGAIQGEEESHGADTP